jgi:hypothetical protein
MITMNFNSRECELLGQWYEAMRDHSGHWGDGNVTTPDESIVLGKIARPGESRFTAHHLELLVQWAEVSIHTAITPEESALLDKILRALGRDISSLNLAKPV